MSKGMGKQGKGMGWEGKVTECREGEDGRGGSEGEQVQLTFETKISPLPIVNFLLSYITVYTCSMTEPLCRGHFTYC